MMIQHFRVYIFGLSLLAIFILFAVRSAQPPVVSTTPTQELLPLNVFERRIAEKLDSATYARIAEHNCIDHLWEYQQSVVDALQMLVQPPISTEYEMKELPSLVTKATSLPVTEFMPQGSTFLIGLPRCRPGSPSHTKAGTYFYLISRIGHAQFLGWGELVQSWSLENHWALLLNVKGNNWSGPNPHELWLIDHENAPDSGHWQKRALAFEPAPYSHIRVGFEDSDQPIHVQMNHWGWDPPCQLTDEFVKLYHLDTWDVSYRYVTQGNNFKLVDKEIHTWHVTPYVDTNGQTRRTITDWQHYCYEQSEEYWYPSASVPVRSRHVSFPSVRRVLEAYDGPVFPTGFDDEEHPFPIIISQAIATLLADPEAQTLEPDELARAFWTAGKDADQLDQYLLNMGIRRPECHYGGPREKCASVLHAFEQLIKFFPMPTSGLKGERLFIANTPPTREWHNSVHACNPHLRIELFNNMGHYWTLGYGLIEKIVWLDDDAFVLADIGQNCSAQLAPFKLLWYLRQTEDGWLSRPIDFLPHVVRGIQSELNIVRNADGFRFTIDVATDGLTNKLFEKRISSIPYISPRIPCRIRVPLRHISGKKYPTQRLTYQIRHDGAAKVIHEEWDCLNVPNATDPIQPTPYSPFISPLHSPLATPLPTTGSLELVQTISRQEAVDWSSITLPAKLAAGQFNRSIHELPYSFVADIEQVSYPDWRIERAEFWAVNEETQKRVKLTTGIASIEDRYDHTGKSFLTVQRFIEARSKQTSHQILVTDGTSDGTYFLMVEGRTVSGKAKFARFQNELYLTACLQNDDGRNGSALLRTDGTEGGTVLIKRLDDSPAWCTNTTSLAVVGDRLYFGAPSQADILIGNSLYRREVWTLWESDGTSAQTKSMMPFKAFGAAPYTLYQPTAQDNDLYLFFAHEVRRYRVR